jgi:hypothetical protein
MSDFGKKRRVPAAVYRKLLAGLSDTAVAAGEKTGYMLAGYRGDRARHSLALDEAIKAQVDELRSVLSAGERESPFRSALYAIWVRVDRWRMPSGDRLRTDADEAALKRQAAASARAVAEQLRQLAAVADAIALGLDLRAEDFDEHQRVVDFLDAVRGRTSRE